jgi:hypothetical protein
MFPSSGNRSSADPYHVPHRKNAAEWVMWFALLPFVPVARLIERIQRARRRFSNRGE